MVVHQLTVQNTTFQLGKQEAAAVAAPYQLSAGQTFPTEEEAAAAAAPSLSSSSSSSVVSAASADATESSGPAWPSHPPGASWSPNGAHTGAATSSTNKGKIAGITVGVAAAIVLPLTALGIFYHRKHRKRPFWHETAPSQVDTSATPTFSPVSDTASPALVYEKREELPVEACRPVELPGDNVAVEMVAEIKGVKGDTVR